MVHVLSMKGGTEAPPQDNCSSTVKGCGCRKCIAVALPKDKIYWNLATTMFGPP